MPLWDVVAYTYKADVYCPDCTLKEVRKDNIQLIGPEDWQYYPSPRQELEEIAEELGIDWQDERSFDSGDFPKVVFKDQVEDTEYCCSCHSEIG